RGRESRRSPATLAQAAVSLRIEWRRSASKACEDLDPLTRARILEAVEQFAATGHGDGKRLRNRNGECRLRVGDWRVIFLPDQSAQTITILKVAHRREAYG